MCESWIQSPKWSLATVPTEILSLLCFFLRMDDILRLSTTGCPLIIGKLRNQVVLECYEIIGTSNDGCAPPLARWRLDKVRNVRFSKIPSVLTLNLLDGLHKQHVFDRLETFVSDEAGLVEALVDPKPESWTNNLYVSSNGAADLDLSRMFPLLKNLNIRRGYRECGFTMSSYPTSLTSLIVENGFPQSSLSTFPPHLTRLHLLQTDLLGAYSILLPLTLTSLATQFHPESRLGLSLTVENSSVGSKISSEWFLLLDKDDFDASVMSNQSSKAVEFYRSVWNRRHENFGKLRRLKRLVHLMWQSSHPMAHTHDLSLPLQLKTLSVSLPSGYKVTVINAWYPPGLTSLVCDSAFGSKQLFATLPQGLLKLSTSLHFYLEEAKEVVKSLPRGLQTLKLDNTYECTIGALRGIPPRLTSLSLCNLYLCFADIERLPKTLVKLKLRVSNNPDRDMNIVSILPPNLTKLNIHRFFAKGRIKKRSFDWKFPLSLPSSITNWSIGTIHCNDDFIQCVATSSPHLLKNMTTKGLERSSFIYISNNSYKKLEKLEFSFTNKVLPFLYSTTEVLHDTMFRGLSDDSFKNFKELRILNLGTVKNKNAYSTSILEYLPPSLTKLRLEGGTIVDDRIFTMIPKHLVELSVRKLVFTLSSLFTMFPSSMPVLNTENLRRCYIDVLNSFGGRIKVDDPTFDFDWAATTPEVLRFPDCIKSIDLPEDCCGLAFWSTLPQNLTFLKVEKVECLTEDMFCSLPSSLTHIELVSENSLESVSFAHLSKLETLILPSNQVLNDQSLSLLPKSLRVLNLNGHCGLRNGSISSIPRNLVEGYIASSQTSIVSFQPRGLRLFDISTCKEILSIKVLFGVSVLDIILLYLLFYLLKFTWTNL